MSTGIMWHLEANFFPPIPNDIRVRVAEIFDEVVRDAGPFITGWADIPEDWCFEYDDWAVLDREYGLPNGARVSVRSMLDELRLWDALFMNCEEPSELSV